MCTAGNRPSRRYGTRLTRPLPSDGEPLMILSAEPERSDDPRPRAAIEHARAWTRGEVKMMQARAAGGHAMGAARDLRGAARHAAYAAGQAGTVAHVAAHGLGAPPRRSKSNERPRPGTRPSSPAGSSASGSGTNSPRKSAGSSWMTSGCGTSSAGPCSAVELPLPLSSRLFAPHLLRHCHGQSGGLLTGPARTGRRTPPAGHDRVHRA